MGFVNVTSAIRRPFTDISKLLIMAILAVIPVANLFSMGFLFNCLKKRGELPAWRFGLLIDGIRILIVVAIYVIPLLLLFGISYVLEIGADTVFLAPFIIISILSFYFIPAALVVFAKTDSLFNGVIKFAWSRKYLFSFCIGILWAAGLNCISLAIFSFLHLIFPLSLFFIITAIVSLILSFAAQITFLTLITGAYESKD